MPPLAPDEQLLLFPIPSGGTLTLDERGTPVSPEELRRRVGEELGRIPHSFRRNPDAGRERNTGFPGGTSTSGGRGTRSQAGIGKRDRQVGGTPANQGGTSRRVGGKTAEGGKILATEVKNHRLCSWRKVSGRYQRERFAIGGNPVSWEKRVDVRSVEFIMESVLAMTRPIVRASTIGGLTVFAAGPMRRVDPRRGVDCAKYRRSAGHFPPQPAFLTFPDYPRNVPAVDTLWRMEA